MQMFLGVRHAFLLHDAWRIHKNVCVEGDFDTTHFHNEVQSIPAYTRSHKKNPLVHNYHCFYKDLGGTHFLANEANNKNLE